MSYIYIYMLREYNKNLVAILLHNPTVKKFWKSVNSCQSYVWE